MIEPVSQQLISGGSLKDRSFSDPLLPHLIEAMNRAIEIDITVSFILQSGLILLKDAIEDALSRGCKLRLITSDYLGKVRISRSFLPKLTR